MENVQKNDKFLIKIKKIKKIKKINDFYKKNHFDLNQKNRLI